MGLHRTPDHDTANCTRFSFDVWGRFGWFPRASAEIEVRPGAIEICASEGGRPKQPLVHTGQTVYAVRLNIGIPWRMSHLVVHDSGRFALIYVKPSKRWKTRAKVRAAGFDIVRVDVPLWTALIGPILRRSLARRGVLPESFARLGVRRGYSPVRAL
ncbi:MAG TPA: hypothetical protein VGO97_01370 [Solirubrobacterales bacterium]|jgi:hypothetical protein|nr:hypothetical protein [Solirubrobacterales bacterium]